MGNQPSSPAPPPTPEAPSVPELPPPCDLQCLKQKQLAQLKQAMDSAVDPQQKEKSRIAYYTLLNGQGWLMTEKQRIAKDEVQPVLTDYTTQYKNLTEQTKSQGVFTNLADFLQAQESSDSADNQFLKKQVQAEKDKADVLTRMNQLSNVVTPETNNYVSIGADILIVFMVITLGGMAYTKFSSS